MKKIVQVYDVCDSNKYEDTILHALLDDDELRREEKRISWRGWRTKPRSLSVLGVRALHELSLT